MDRRSLLLGTPLAAAFAASAVAAPTADDFGIAQLKRYRTRRASSWDRSGGNADFITIAPGATATLLDSAGPGAVTHVWFTINSREDFHLKKLVLRAYWDGEPEASVEVPVGDFFGLMLGDYFLYESALTSVAPIKALNSYFPMPFGKSARITVSNEGQQPAASFYFNIDYVTFPTLPDDTAYFHAQYRQQTPTHGWSNEWKNQYAAPYGEKKNLSGADNYVFMEARGRGHYVGVTQGVLQNQEGWFGEGDEMMFIDSDSPVITGTGTEDFYNGAWNFGGANGAKEFSYAHNGMPFVGNPEHIGGRYCLYRWHLESPVTFEKNFKMTIEHGHANVRSDSFFSTAYWYQTEPHLKFPALPPVQDRIPRVIAVGGPSGA